MITEKISIILFIFFASTCYTYANWYGNHSVSAPNPGSMYLNGSSNRGTACDTDGDTTGGSNATYGDFAVADNNDSSTLTPESDSEYNIPAGQAMRCLYWDRYNPQDLSINYSAGWYGPSGTTINVQARDRGGSGVNTIQLQESRNGGGYITVQTWPNIGASNNANVSRSWLKVPTSSEENDTFNYRTIVTDLAENTATFTNSTFIQFDLTPPKVTDINTPSPIPSSNLIAVASQNFMFSVSNAGGSPISRIESYFEDYTTTNSYGTVNISNGSVHSISPSIQDVDSDGSPTDGVREYSHKVTRICDQTGNCIGTTGSNPPALSTPYNYYVHANTTNITTKSITSSQVSDIEDTDNIADGTTYPLGITLRDQFGNRIIPVSSIGRQINFNIDARNTVYLDQFTRTGNSGVLISSPDPGSYTPYPLTTSTPTVYSNQPSTDGVYNFDFRLYTPTRQYATDRGADPEASFNINNITLNVSHGPGYSSWSPGNTIVDSSSGIDFSFAPLFHTEFNGELKNTGFIEGILQSSSISLVKNSTKTLGSDPGKMYLKYNGDSDVLNKLELTFGSTAPTEIVSEAATLSSDIPSGSFTPNTYNLATRLSQQAGTTIDDIESTYLSTHLSYRIDGQNVVLNSDVIGRNNYYDTVNQSSTNQAGVKILGVSASDKIQELVSDQFTDDVRIIGKLTKSAFRKDISQKVFNLARSVPDFSGTNPRVGELGTNWATSSQNNGEMTLGDSVIVYKSLGGKYVEIQGDMVSGAKTIVIIGGDAYITGNITNSTTNSVLGIIALKDSSGRGGRIFVDHEVTDLHAILYAEKTLMTALHDNGDGIIDITSSEVINSTTTSAQLRDQLYIYGSLFSENTIGGSKAVPLECPYYTTCSNGQEAQKYDLNYMRRYVQIDTDTPPDGIPDTNANGGKTSARATALGQNENFPLVIEYNSAIQSSPPPLFK